MPDPREIGRLKKIIRALAKEDSVLEEKGEPYVELPPPPPMKPLPPDAESRLEPGAGRLGESGSGGFAEVPDFSSLLAGIDLDAPPEDEFPGTPSRTPEPEAPPAGGMFESTGDFTQGAGFSDDLLMDLGPPEESGEPEGTSRPEGMSEPEELAADEETLPAGGEPSEPIAEEGGDFDLGEFAASMMGDSVPADAAGTPAGSTSGDDDFSALADLVLGSGDSGGVQDGEGAGIEPGAEERLTPLEDIAIPDFGDGAGDASGIDEGGSAADEPAPPGELESVSQVEDDIPSFEDAFAEPPPAADAWQEGEEASPPEEIPEEDASAPEEAASGFSAPPMDEGGFDLGGEDRGGKLSASAGDEDLPAFHPEFNIPDDELPPPRESEVEEPSVGGSDGFAQAGGFEFASPPSRAAAKSEEPDEADAGTGSKVALTEKQLDKLQDSLLSYPLNLRLEIEKGIASETLDDDQAAKVIDLLVEGASARTVAGELGRMLGKRIAVPKGFERRTGEDLEAEQGSFWYAFRKNFLPLAGAVLLAIAGTAALVLLGHRFVYRPVKADGIYREGYRAVVDQDYVLSERLFDKAYGVQGVKRWHFRYASAYAERKQYFLAEKKYDEIINRYGKDKRAAMEWARMESEVLLDYEKADELLKDTILDWKPRDPDAILLSGDNHLAWADDLPAGAERDEHLEAARKAYASLVRMRGKKDQYMGRMALYFIRADKLSEALPIKEYLLSEKKADVDARVYAELGGYLIDRGRLDGVQILLMAGAARDPSLPETHYQLARFFRATGVKEEERKAVMKAIAGYEALPALTKRRAAERIDSLKWAGRWYFEAGELIPAEGYFVKAVAAYEDALEKRFVKPGARFGEVYAGLADVHYYDIGDLSQAYALYEKAESNGYVTRETDYRRGFIDYRRGEYASALRFFYSSSIDSEEEDNLLYAMANTLYRREDFAAASGYYEKVILRMQDRIDRFIFEDPQDRPAQRRIVLLLMTARNNLGVSLYRLSSRLGDASRRSRAMAELSESSRLYDVLTRDQDSMVRSDEPNLAFSNMRGLIRPSADFVLQIYSDLAREMVDSDERILVDSLLKQGGL